MGGNPVKGAPYSAQGVTETTQTLADGNRIVQKNTATLYRDSEGRERREQTLSAIGPFTAPGDAPTIISISDPVAGVNYSLNPSEKIAVKLPAVPDGLPGAPPAAAGPNVKFGVMINGPGPGAALGPGGPQVMIYKGNSVTARRCTERRAARNEGDCGSTGRWHAHDHHAIPAGQMGNDRAIDIVDEQWRSPELRVTVLSKHSDPRMGETVYSLTNIDRSEPLLTLFQIPSDYTIEDGPVMFKQKLPAQ